MQGLAHTDIEANKAGGPAAVRSVHITERHVRDKGAAMTEVTFCQRHGTCAYQNLVTKH